jgi:hypothetical protein
MLAEGRAEALRHDRRRQRHRDDARYDAGARDVLILATIALVE